MNFFEAQAKAKRHTGWLLLLFALAVLALIVLTNLLVLAVVLFRQNGYVDFSLESIGQFYEIKDYVAVALIVSLFIFLGSFYKTMTLSAGGRSVAELLGGVLVSRNTTETKERQLLNVVEEMAIAAGISVPQVYLLDESGINAFAAGWSPNSAVIGVTRGALLHLNRDELQGVIAHEFGHIFNGDMRLNIRLMGVLHGILLVGLSGYYLLRVLRHARLGSRNQKGGSVIAAFFFLGIGLVVIGYVGHFFGQWIKSIISRQREYLADATAVRYTRNKDGIAGALKKIGGVSQGSLLSTPAAPEYSHACFSQAVSGFLPYLFSTHPPLSTRIKRIDPHWNGKYPRPGAGPGEARQDTKKARPKIGGAEAAILGGAIAAGAITPNAIIERIGNVDEKQVVLARQILADIPPALRSAVEEAFGARAVIYGLLLDSDAAIREQQQQLLVELADPAVLQLMDRLEVDVEVLPEHARLPLLELAITALRSLSLSQYKKFKIVVDALIKADRKVNLKEWVLQRFVVQPLDEHFDLRKRPMGKHTHLGAVKREAEILLSLVAHIEHDNASEAEQAFKAAIKAAGTSALKFVPRDEISLASLNQAIDELDKVKPMIKPRILKACAACIMFDGRVTVRGQELLRAVASCLDSPMPPLGSLIS